jgi:predicted nucleotidyltransferase
MAAQSGMTESPLVSLQRRLGATWGNIEQARRTTEELVIELGEKLEDLTSSDCSLVVFGSLAREEAVKGSDLDWALLIDGLVDPKHRELVHEIGSRIAETGVRPPGREGTFGRMIVSHELIHRIGGEDDTNSNTTRRILLLLESLTIGPSVAHERVLRTVLQRYLGEDRGLWYGRSERVVPRFLLNDIVRYWRTLTVDFAYKQADRGGRGFAIRNVKLRLSRKLIFVSGLVLCFAPALVLDEQGAAELRSRKDPARLIELLLDWIALSPLDKVAKALLPFEEHHEAARVLMDNYDAFLGLLGDPAKREELETVSYDDLGRSEAFRDGLSYSSEFQRALESIFLRGGGPLTDLTLKFGVF